MTPAEQRLIETAAQAIEGPLWKSDHTTREWSELCDYTTAALDALLSSPDLIDVLQKRGVLEQAAYLGPGGDLGLYHCVKPCAACDATEPVFRARVSKED